MLEKLDAEMIKLLAWQRIQQLFPTKTPSSLHPTEPPKTPKPDGRTLSLNLVTEKLHSMQIKKICKLCCLHCILNRKNT